MDKVTDCLSDLEVVASRASSLLSKLENKTIVEKILSDDFSETNLLDKKDRLLASLLFVGTGNRFESEDVQDPSLDERVADVKEYIIRNNCPMPSEGEARNVPNRMYTYIGENEFRASFAISTDDLN